MSSLNLNKYASFAEYYADTRPVGEHNVSYIGNEYVIYDDEEIYDMQGNKIDWPAPSEEPIDNLINE